MVFSSSLDLHKSYLNDLEKGRHAECKQGIHFGTQTEHVFFERHAVDADELV